MARRAPHARGCRVRPAGSGTLGALSLSKRAIQLKPCGTLTLRQYPQIVNTHRAAAAISKLWQTRGCGRARKLRSRPAPNQTPPNRAPPPPGPRISGTAAPQGAPQGARSPASLSAPPRRHGMWCRATRANAALPTRSQDARASRRRTPGCRWASGPGPSCSSEALEMCRGMPSKARPPLRQPAHLLGAVVEPGHHQRRQLHVAPGLHSLGYGVKHRPQPRLADPLVETIVHGLKVDVHGVNIWQQRRERLRVDEPVGTSTLFRPSSLMS